MSSLPELREAFTAEIESHLALVSAPTRAVLSRLVQHDGFAGSTDPTALTVVLSIVRSVQPRLMLELGTHVGFSALCIADALEHNAVKGELVTVDPNAAGQAVAAEFLGEAGLSHRVHFIHGRSTDAAVAEQLREVAPFALAYLDSSHAYESTLQELELLHRTEGGWLLEHGLLVAHDAAPEAAVFDPSGCGGVARALAEWMATHGAAYELFVLGPPLWPCACGVGLLRRRPAAGQRKKPNVLRLLGR